MFRYSWVNSISAVHGPAAAVPSGKAPSFAKHYNGGAAKAEDGLFLAALKRLIEGVRLGNSSNRQRSNLHKSEASEMVSAQNVYAPLVAEKDILLAP